KAGLVFPVGIMPIAPRDGGPLTKSGTLPVLLNKFPTREFRCYNFEALRINPWSPCKKILVHDDAVQAVPGEGPGVKVRPQRQLGSLVLGKFQVNICETGLIRQDVIKSIGLIGDHDVEISENHELLIRLVDSIRD